MVAPYEDELPHGPASTVRILSRAESLAAIGLSEADADPEMFSEELDSAFGGGAAPVRLVAGAGPLFVVAPIPPVVDGTEVFPAGGEVVDIYLSAGLHQNLGRSCKPNHYTGCSLWRIRLNLWTKHVFLVEELQNTAAMVGCPEGTSHLQPAVSPNGERYAWRRTCLGPFGAEAGVEIVSQAVASEGIDPPQTVVRGSVSPMYPNWYDDHTLLYTYGAGNLARVVDWATAPSVTVELGPAGLRAPHYTWHDAYTSQTPADSTVAGRPRIVSFGGFIAAAGPFHLPQVADLHGHDVSHFDIPQPDWQPKLPDPPECHHPAWRPDGARILCTRYQAAESITGDTQTPTVTADYDVRRLYEFSWDGTTWVRHGGVSAAEPGSMVEALTGAEFNLIARDAAGNTLELFKPRVAEDPKSGGCGAYVWKFAEWCASDRYVVSTVYCTDSTSPDQGEPLHSRVVLIDTKKSSSHLGYTDLITLIEYHLDATGGLLGKYSGVFSTCSPVPDGDVAAGPGA